jgi:hypothetical protein
MGKLFNKEHVINKNNQELNQESVQKDTNQELRGELIEVPSIPHTFIPTIEIDLTARYIESILPETPDHEDLNSEAPSYNVSEVPPLPSSVINRDRVSDIDVTNIPLPESVESRTSLPLSSIDSPAQGRSGLFIERLQTPNILPHNLDVNRPNIMIDTNIPLNVVSDLNTD